MASTPAQVSIQGPDGSCKVVEVEAGTAVCAILDDEAFRPPASYTACLVTETAEVLAPDHKLWEPQLLTLVRFKSFTQATNSDLCQRDELVFLEIPRHTACVEDGAFMFGPCLQEVEIPASVNSIGSCLPRLRCPETCGDSQFSDQHWAWSL